jgi:hypothetical protein
MSTLLEVPVEQFGKARVEFGVRGLVAPERTGDVLAFPFEFERRGIEMHSLHGGEQFLVIDGERTYFGGTDEQPFLVRLDRDHLIRFRHGGEKAFYKGLKPSRLSYYEAITKTTALRQGDIWALPLGDISWDQLQADFRVAKRRRLKMSRYWGEMRVFQTRHDLVGTWTISRPYLRYNGKLVELRGRAVEGILKAPDHEDLVLNGPHLLVATRLNVRREPDEREIRGGD